jgi:hypothetical protein
MGKSEYEGAYLYRAAPKFLEVFGLESFAHLPPLNIEQERESEFPDPDEDFAKLKASLKPIVSEPSPLKWDDPETEAKDAKILAEIGRQIAGLKTTASPYIEPHRNGTY